MVVVSRQHMPNNQPPTPKVPGAVGEWEACKAARACRGQGTWARNYLLPLCGLLLFLPNLLKAPGCHLQDSPMPIATSHGHAITALPPPTLTALHASPTCPDASPPTTIAGSLHTPAAGSPPAATSPASHRALTQAGLPSLSHAAKGEQGSNEPHSPSAVCCAMHSAHHCSCCHCSCCCHAMLPEER